MTGVVILALALAAALAFGLHRRRVDGRFALAPLPSGDEMVRGVPGDLPQSDPAAPWTSIAAALPEARLGDRATFVQFSSAFCAPCRSTRVLLDDVATGTDGVAHVEIDAEKHLALVRELDVRRTPTTLVLDRTGREITRAAGAPRREQVLAALPARHQETP